MMTNRFSSLDDVLDRAAAVLGSAAAVRWLDGPIAAFGGLTPRRLVAEGYTDPVLRYLATLVEGGVLAGRHAGR